jgi:hypothetical protein
MVSVVPEGSGFEKWLRTPLEYTPFPIYKTLI